MTSTQPTVDTLSIDELGDFAPNLCVAEAYRLAFKDEAGQFRWRADDVRAYDSGHPESYPGASAYGESE